MRDQILGFVLGLGWVLVPGWTLGEFAFAS